MRVLPLLNFFSVLAASDTCNSYYFSHSQKSKCCVRVNRFRVPKEGEIIAVFTVNNKNIFNVELGSFQL